MNGLGTGAKSGQHGFSMVEVVVAALLLMLGSLAMLSVVDAATRNNYRAEQSQVVVNQLQAELEKIRQLPFAQIALSSAPPSSSDPDKPSWRVSGSQFATKRAGTDLRAMVINGTTLVNGGTVSGGAISAAGTPFQSGDVSGTIRRYVVWINDTKCPAALCPGSQDLKRVIVTAEINSTPAGGDRSYQELHTDIVDPDANPVVDSVPPGSGAQGTFATLWLTDTSCSQSERQPIIGDHGTRNTLGNCADGPELGDEPGAPDLMYINPPPLNPNLPPDQQPLHDYSTDVEPEVGAALDRGLQIRHSGLPGCVYSPTLADGVPGQKVHRWLSPPVAPGKELFLDGEATLSLWSRTLNGADHPGEICVFLFVRKPNVQGEMVDELVENEAIAGATWFPHEEASWPRANWTETSVPMDFRYSGGSVLPGERLGLAISVERGGTNPGDGLEFIYDHPSFDSRLQIKTSSQLPVFEGD
jgi:type II secretory pathway pseudopilin PulG